MNVEDVWIEKFCCECGSSLTESDAYFGDGNEFDEMCMRCL